MIKKKKPQKQLLSPPPPERIFADPETGLSGRQVLDRIIAGQTNQSPNPEKTVGQIILSNLFTYFNLIFFILSGCLIAVGAYNDLLFMPIVLANILIGTIQEIRSKRVLDRLTLVNSPRATVVRDGIETETTTDNLVLDDIAVFSAGGQISADATVLSGEVSVNESLVTGEPDEIIKKEGSSLLSGSFVTAGKCRARLEKVGADSYVSRLALEAKKSKKKRQVGMMRSLTLLIKIIGVIIIPVGAVMFWRQTGQLGLPVADAVVKTTAALIGMIPEGLYLLVSVALAAGVMRLAKKKTLAHELSAIETLARVDMLCVDKTGTITENEMQCDEIVSLGADMDALEEIMAALASSSADDNDTMKAIKKRFSSPPPSSPLRLPRRADSVIPFSSARKYSGAVFGGVAYLLGAPEFIMRDRYGLIKEKIEEAAATGSRVLLLAEAASPVQNGAPRGDASPLALVLLSNRIRPEAEETFRYFSRQGVNIKVISGDNPITASAAAQRAGIKGADLYIDASTLDTAEKITEAAPRYTVFGRVTPEQKRQLVRALKKRGHTVAMTGDGVNDVLALKEADCGIAMASGSEAAGQVSQLVLLDSNFASLPAAVAEGRRVINNIERAAALFLVKNIFSFFLAWISIFAVFAYPIEPSQLSLINSVTIGIPSFFLAMEPNNSLVKGKFLRGVLLRALPAALTCLFLSIGAELFAVAFNISYIEVSTITAVLMGVTGLIMLYRVCLPLTLTRKILIVSMCAAFAIGLALPGELFSLTLPSFGGALVLVTLALLAAPTMIAFSNIINFIIKLCFKIKAGYKAFIKEKGTGTVL